MLFEGFVDDDESPALSGSRLSFPDTDLAGGSPVAALKVERSDWKLMAGCKQWVYYGFPFIFPDGVARIP